MKKLEDSVQKFGERVKAGIQERIDQNIEDLVKTLLPALTEHPPDEWIPSTGERPDQNVIRERLTWDLRSAFGSAQGLIREMGVKYRIKGVTYELLNDKTFLESVARAIPELERFHREFVTAEAVSEAHDQTRLFAD